MSEAAVRECWETISHHSKSFSFAARLLPGDVRDDVAVLYTWCRRADDAVDRAGPGEAPAALAVLREELAGLYDGRRFDEVTLAAMQWVVTKYGIPRRYPEELLAGMEMDVRGTRYRTVEDLDLYAYRVAGVVGLMMSHVLGVREEKALRPAAHLGMAMQLTNIARDVAEDWERGRLYLPDEMLAEAGMTADLAEELGKPLAVEHGEGLSRALKGLLERADRFYGSADRGIPMLSARAGWGVRTARLVYSRIGSVVARKGYDVFAGRAYVTGAMKGWLAVVALVGGARGMVSRGRFERVGLERVVEFPGDVLPI
ncbi:MAG TPA: phytoene/squalene synthase family protein [Kiritimatiellia bacterium]|nr:phytoene/squalene synthase family protein [Kiritimatiellia bacterium]